jgi:N-acetyl-anhydromuramyl-L-alanine amidase AmpD
VGDKIIEEPQYVALLGMIKLWVLKYSIEIKNVIGHREVNPNKTCPNLNMDKLRDEISFKVGGLN